jgi:ferredoxin-NADP reductase
VHLGANLIHWLGVGIIALVALQALAMFVSTAPRISSQTRQQRLAEEILEEQLRTARARRVIREESSHSWNGWRKFRVLRKVQESADVVSIYLTPHDNIRLPSFEPGQFLTFQLRIPGVPQPVVRCYSLSDAPAEDCYRISVKRVPAAKPDLKPGVVSNYFHDVLKEGDIIDVKAPGGAFFLDLASRTPIVLIAGGIGITPVLSMVNSLARQGAISRETWFFLGARNGEENFAREHLRALAAKQENLKVHFCYSAPAAHEKQGVDYDEACRVSADLFKKLLPSNNYEYYLCGPPAFMESLTSGLREWGVPDGSVHFEAFGPASVPARQPAPATAAPGGASPSAGPVTTRRVNFARSGKELAWSGDAGNLLELAEKNGVMLPSGCRSGNCGTCLTAVKSGKVEYNKPPACQPEAGSCLTCIGVPAGELVLDA